MSDQQGDVISVPVDPGAHTHNAMPNNGRPTVPQAPEPAQQGFAQGVGEGVRFTAEDIEKARREEKDKLYPRLEALDTELKGLRDEAQRRRQAEEAEVQARVAAEEQAKVEQAERMSAQEQIQAMRAEMDERLRQERERTESIEAVLNRERELQTLIEYRDSLLRERGEQIMPQLRDLVAGNSREEIDAAFADAIRRTEAIVSDVAAAQQRGRQEQRGTTVTAPPNGPLEAETAYETFTPEQIRDMDMATYERYRARLLNLGNRPNRDRGLY